MLKKIKMLFKLRAWMQSRTLNFSALLTAFVAVDLTLDNDLIATVVEWIANAGGMTTGTALAALVALREVVSVLLRAKTDRSLDDK